MKARTFTRGFTLIEVLIALAIVAFGLAALFTTVNQTVRTSDYLREKTFGEWIALNRITEARMAPAPPGDKEQKGTVEFAGGTWRWELKAIKTPVAGIVRLEARAAPEGMAEGSWPGLATGFMGTQFVEPPQMASGFKAAMPGGPAPKLGEDSQQNQTPASEEQNKTNGEPTSNGSLTTGNNTQ